jgi:hypothetical protein
MVDVMDTCCQTIIVVVHGPASTVLRRSGGFVFFWCFMLLLELSEVKELRSTVFFKTIVQIFNCFGPLVD